MSTAQHTPGPWSIGKINQDSVSGTIPITTPGYRETFRDGVLIASVYGTAARSEANARLIAAAPDLLEALGELMEWEEEIAADLGVHTSSAKPMLAKARAAIAKAKGGVK